MIDTNHEFHEKTHICTKKILKSVKFFLKMSLLEIVRNWRRKLKVKVHPPGLLLKAHGGETSKKRR